MTAISTSIPRRAMIPKGIEHTDIETPGAHTWMVWWRNLAEFFTLLFQGKKP